MSRLTTSGILQQSRNLDNNFPLSGLVSYYKLDGTTGDVLDSYGINHGINTGSTRGVAGKLGNSFYFNGSSNYVYMGTNAILGTTFTLALWLKLDSPATYARILTQGVQCNSNSHTLYFHSGKINVASGTNDDMSVDPSRAGVINNNEWTLVVWTQEELTSTNLYLNDVLKNDSTAGYGLIPYGGFSIGARNIPDSPMSFYKGHVDEVGIWDRILTREEITALYNNGNGMTL